MHREDISKLVTNILRIEGWTQENLAAEVGVTQPAVARWKNCTITPRPRHLSKLREIYSRARAHYWASNQFIPICAIADIYPSELPALATQALNEMMAHESLTTPLKGCTDNISIDIHVRPANLPKYASAYTFANDLLIPTVFVILVQKKLSLADQRKFAWKEFYAHVAQYPFKDYADDEKGNTQAGGPSKRPLSVSEPVVQHYLPKRNRHHEGAKDKN